VLTVDQSNLTPAPPTSSINFRNASSSQDLGEKFQVGTTEPLSKVQFYIKKVSTPSDITVRIVSDSNGSPGTTNITTGTLTASSVSTNYGWVNVSFNTNPELNQGTTYWIILDAATNSTKYYKIGTNSSGYADGVGKIGQYGSNWNNTSPSGLDSFFKLYLGGITGLIDGITVGTGSIGDAYANTVTDTIISGTNYCKIGSGNNKVCNTSRDNPVFQTMPISEQNIIDWKNVAENTEVFNGDKVISSNTSLGPIKM